MLDLKVCPPTSSKKMFAICLYSGDLNAKSRSKDSQVVAAVGPRLNSQVVSR